MKLPLIVFLIFLGITLKCSGQDFKEKYWPSELNEPGYNVWVSGSTSHMNRWLESDNYSTSNPFQYLTAIHPCDSIRAAKYNLGEIEEGAYIFTFGDSLTVQTYDGLNREIIKIKSYGYKKSTLNDGAYLIYMDGYYIRLTRLPTYGYFHFVEVDFIGLPILENSERNEWLTNIKGKTNLFHCENKGKKFNMTPLTMKNTGRSISLSEPIGDTEEERMFTFLTFGDSLRMNAYDAKINRTIKVACFEYELIENNKFSISYWVYLTDRKAKLTISPNINSSHYNIEVDCE
ncbi:MAG: hypothetical protein MK105_08450 [Crocinitomicaceae bacterium]|nr:hypothetical protein [Crocinitomicaceae bacterium]